MKAAMLAMDKHTPMFQAAESITQMHFEKNPPDFQGPALLFPLSNT